MRYLFLIALVCTLSACDQAPGPDSLSSHEFGQLGTGNCSCHGAAIGSRRQVLGAGGDFASNPSVTSHHVQGGADPTEAQCLVCHDVSQHTQGTVRLRQADTGTVISYSTPASLEPFCLGCHDADGALTTAVNAAAPLSPFGDGATLGTVPYGAGVTIASSWSGSSAHRAQGLTCAGTGAAGTGCHGRSGAVNGHGSVTQGLLTNSMNFQIPLVTEAVYSADPLGSSYSYNNYRLCFDCHDGTPATQATVGSQVVLGFLSGRIYDIFQQRSPFNVQQQSLFRDYYTITSPPFYSDTMWDYPYMALHNYHLIGFESRAIIVPAGVNALAWNYRGDPARAGRITCTACHNVHGTTVPTIRSTHAELGLTRFVNGADIYGTLGTMTLTAAPMNCSVDCHGPGGQTSYWHTPARE